MFPVLPKSGIYMLRNCVTGKYYIGSACDMARREIEHFRMLRRGTHHAKRLQASFNKHGEAAFVFFPLAFVGDVSRLIEIEQVYIDSHGAADRTLGYNSRAKAESNLGHTFGEATRAKISARLKGRKQSAELIAKRTAGQRGRKMPASAVAKSSAARTGKPRPDVKTWAAERFARFNREDIGELKRLKAFGFSTRAIARFAGCQPSTVSLALRGVGAFYEESQNF